MKNILVVGAGFSGAIIARELAQAGLHVRVIDFRPNVAGNCFTKVDEATGVTVHVHGPHIFHTDNTEVWDYVGQFAEFRPYICRIKATTKGRVFSLPINLLTINQFFGKTFTPAQAEQFIASVADRSIGEPRSFEEQALKFLGQELYEAFFKGYPIKQWGYHPRDLPASVLRRLPVRFTYDDNYFNHQHQGIPAGGYTDIVARILQTDRVELSLNTRFDPAMVQHYDHVFFSGQLDSWFDYRLGDLGYRTLDFVETRHDGDYQGCAVMSYPDEEVPFTRITEHKHFAPWEKHDRTIVFHEYSRECTRGDIPYYPIRLLKEQTLLADYVALAQQQQKVTFVGRLGTYRYLDMDVTIAEALKTAREFVARVRSNAPIPPFFADVLG